MAYLWVLFGFWAGITVAFLYVAAVEIKGDAERRSGIVVEVDVAFCWNCGEPTWTSENST